MLPEEAKRPLIEKGPEIAYTGKKKRLFYYRFLLILAALIILITGILTEMALAPKMRLLAETEAVSRIASFLNDAVEEAVLDGRIRYEKLAVTEYDAAGNLSAVRSDTGALNRIAASIARKVQEELDASDYFTVRLPISSLWGGYLFAGHGIPVKIRMVPVGSVTGEIESRAETKGINQTRHVIVLLLHFHLNVLLPGKDGEVQETLRVPLCENLYLGSVPRFFAER